MKQNYEQILSQKEYLKLTGANFINRLGDSIDMIAFTWLIYDLTGSASWSAIMFGVNMMPNVLIQPLAGAIVEKMEKKRILILTDVARGFLTACIAILFVRGLLKPWMLLAITFLNNTLEAFHSPASTSFIPSILDKQYYDFGISFAQSSYRICELIGTGVGGILIASAGIFGAIICDAISFILSALLIFCIHVKEESISSVKQEKTHFQLLKEGVGYVKGIPVLIFICFGCALTNVVLVPYNSFLTPFISDILHEGATMLSLSSIALSIGMGIGSFIYPYLHTKITNRTLFLWGGFATGVYYILLVMMIPFNEMFLVAMMFISSFLFGCFIALMINVINIALMKQVEKTYLARVSAILNASSTLALPITSFLMSVICLHITIPMIFLSFALFTFLVFAGMIFMKSLKQL